DIMPAHPAMALHVAVRDAVRHALVADRLEQPIEYYRGVVPANGGDHAVRRQTDAAVIEKGRRAGSLADLAHQADGPVKARRLVANMDGFPVIHGNAAIAAPTVLNREIVLSSYAVCIRYGAPLYESGAFAKRSRKLLIRGVRPVG